MTSIEIIVRAKQLIKATQQQHPTDCLTIIQSLLADNPAQWPTTCYPWVIAGLIHCMDRLPLANMDTLLPSVFQLLSALLDNQGSHGMIIEGLPLQRRTTQSPQRFLIIPRLVIALTDHPHTTEAFYLAQQLLTLQSHHPQSDLFQGLLPLHSEQLQTAILNSHKTPLSPTHIASLELMAQGFPVAFDQLIAPLPRRMKHRVVSRLSVKWPRGWVAESRMTKIPWWQRVGVALF